MILLIDIGNTRVKWAYAEDDTLRDSGVATHGGQPVHALGQQRLTKPDSAWLSCVGTSDKEAVAENLQRLLGVRPHVVRSEAQRGGLTNSYAEPQRLGVDRWLALLAAWSSLRKPFCLVGAGTALTFDRVDAGGRHLGGLIGPGLTSMQHSLLSVTQGRPAELVRPYSDHLGRDTEGAVRQAAFFSSLGIIERGLRAPGADENEVRLINGGDAGELLPTLGSGWQHRPQLVLEGLLAVARSTSE